MYLHRSTLMRIGAGATAATLLLTGCGGSGSDGETSGTDDTPTVRLAALDQGTSGLALKVIEEQGLAEKHGFSAEFQYIPSDAAAQNFLQGQSDINFNSSPNDVALAAENGYDAVTISSEAQWHPAIIARTDSPYTDMESLKGKTIGWFGSDSTAAVVMGYFLAENQGIDLFNDYEFVQTSPSALVQLLAEGQVDAIMDFQPWISWANSEVPGGVKVIYDPNEEWQEATGGNLWVTSISVMEDFLNENEEATANVVNAWCDAAEYINDNIHEMISDEAFTEFLQPLTEGGLEAYAEWVSETRPFHCGWDKDQIANANEFLDALAEHGELITDNPGDLIVDVRSDGEK